MEESTDSSINSSSHHHCHNELSQSFSEESSWTMYIEEFIMASEKKRATHNNASSSTNEALESSSTFSDAACSTIKVKFKKRKVLGNLEHDDPLEDTASSPVNSPKVTDVNKMEKDDKRMMFKEEEVGCGKDTVDSVTRGGDNIVDGMGTVDGTRNECTELNKRGLCVVPLTMFLDHVE